MSGTSAFNAKRLTNGVRADWVDLRDLFYSPSLSTLKTTCPPNSRLFKPGIGPVFGLRNQGDSGRCVGHAMANMIDMQRALQSDVGLTPEDQVSSDMLYHMARFHDPYSVEMSGAEGVRSLRSGIKGFYHHGVCLDIPTGLVVDSVERLKRWESLPYRSPPKVQDEDTFPTVDRARAAREISLGAYYRLHPILNHYHAALNEAGVVLVSANISMGWQNPDREIAYGRDVMPLDDTHAVVIIGYNERGFLVLNSWGDWGGFDDLPGVALWTYADWAENVVDGWVLRLGVPAPAAFDLSIGEQGTNRIYGATQAGSVPCRELLGHFLHLDDGHHVEFGAYPSSVEMMDRTLAFLDKRLAEDAADERYRGVVLWIAGSSESLADGFPAAVRRKKWFKDQGLFLITVFWCSDFVEQAIGVLEQVVKDSKEQAGEDAAHLDQLIENRARGIGRAFWRDVEHAAQRAVDGITDHPLNQDPPEKPGHLQILLEQLTKQVKTHGTALHIVTEGAGALVLAEWLEQSQGHHSRVGESLGDDHRYAQLAAKAGLVTSATLSLPAIDVPRAHNGLIEFMGMLNDRGNHTAQDLEIEESARATNVDTRAETWNAPPPAARVFIPIESLEQRIHMGAYGKSNLHLVANAFEDRRGTSPGSPQRVMLGMAEAAKMDIDKALFAHIHPAPASSHATGPVAQSDLTNNPVLEAEILASILHHTPKE